MSGNLPARSAKTVSEETRARQRGRTQPVTTANSDEMTADTVGLDPARSLQASNWADYSKVALTDFSPGANGATALKEMAHAEDETAADAPDLVEEPKDGGEAAKAEIAHADRNSLASASSENISTVLKAGRQPLTYAARHEARGFDRALRQTVDPGGKPTEGATENSCLPSTASATLAWDVIDVDKDNWGADVQSLTLAGKVNVKPWPSNPSSMTVPNTPNPVDGGNINNTAGSDNNWQAAIDDMADYNLANGGAGPNWHSTAASHAHEWAHWNTDYVIDSVGSAAGGNWPKVNADIDALRQPKATSATAAAAKTALTPRVDTQLGKWRSNTIKRWNAIPDTAGVAGSTGYEAGAAVLATLIASVRAYAVSKGWAAAPPAPRAPSLPPRTRPGQDIPP